MSNNPFRTDNKNNQSGFSLVELVIVVALIAILMSIAIPRLPMSSNRELELAARELASNLRLVRSEAIASGSKCRAYFYTDDGYYKLISKDSDPIYLPEGITFLLIYPDTGPNAETNFVNVPNDPDIPDDPDDPDNLSLRYIHFTDLGRPYSAGRIVLLSEDGEKRYIKVLPNTGRIKVDLKKQS